MKSFGELPVSHGPQLLQLLSHTGAVLEFLLQHTSTEGMEESPLHEKQRKVLRCLLSWV